MSIARDKHAYKVVQPKPKSSLRIGAYTRYIAVTPANSPFAGIWLAHGGSSKRWQLNLPARLGSARIGPPAVPTSLSGHQQRIDSNFACSTRKTIPARPRAST